MSNLNEYALIIATFILGAFLIAYLTKLQNSASIEVLTGVLRGVPMSTEMRWIWFLQVFVGFAIFILVVDFFLMFAFMRIAANVAADVRWLAYLGAAWTGGGFLLQFLFGTSAVIKHVALLRQSTRA